MKNFILENLKTIFYALIIAIIIRSLLIQPFYIPSSSMEPTLQVGDRLFVTKYTYGFSKHSFPFSLGPIKERIFYSEPKRGDVVVFKTPSDNRTDYIKRVIGLPGEKLQFIDGNLFIDDLEILKSKEKNNLKVFCGNKEVKVNIFSEKIEYKEYLTAYFNNGSFQNSDEYLIPPDHFFFLGDNRDCSKDSRYLTSVGFVEKNNLVGKARFIFFSSDIRLGNLYEIWKWKKIIRVKRFFKKII